MLFKERKKRNGIEREARHTERISESNKMIGWLQSADIPVQIHSKFDDYGAYELYHSITFSLSLYSGVYLNSYKFVIPSK